MRKILPDTEGHRKRYFAQRWKTRCNSLEGGVGIGLSVRQSTGMEVFAEWSAGAASAKLWIDGDVAVFDTRGVLTRASIVGLYAYAAAALKDSGRRAYAAVARYDGATLAMDDLPLALDVSMPIRRQVPVALVAGPTQLEMAWRYCWAMADHGIERITYENGIAAMEWARDRARVARAADDYSRAHPVASVGRSTAAGRARREKL